MKLDLPTFGTAGVLVVGDLMLDRYWEGPAGRISPEAPVPVVRIEQTRDAPGGAGNVALNVAALGCSARVAGYTGDDEQAATLQAMLQGAGVQTDFTRLPGYPTVTKLRVISQRQQLLRLDFEHTTLPTSAPPLAARLDDLLAGCGVLLLSDYAKGALRDAAPLIELARARGVPVLVDPKGADYERYRGATLLTPNLAELEQVVGPCNSEADLGAACLRLIGDLQLEGLLVTRGEQGMTLFRAGRDALHLPTRAREVFDVTGAGDTVVAVLAAALASGAALEDAVSLANTAAGIVVGKMGTATVSAYELGAAVARAPGPGRGVLTPEQLQAALAEARGRGERIVFTNGCFDVIHAGHIQYLREARQQGERLVVAVNSDASVRRLKGAGRPVNPVERRMAVLAELESVDWVVSFEEDTPLDLLRSLRPEVLVKGGDYRRKEEVVGWQVVEEYGGRVALMGKVEDVSTTAIMARLQGD